MLSDVLKFMRVTLPTIYPITDRQLSGLSHAEQVRRLIDGGATVIQLRDKQLASTDFLREAEAALRIAHDNRVVLIINDRVDIAISIGANGVHLGQTDLPVVPARRLMKDRGIVGFSTHSLAQVRAALELPLTYLAFGPIFNTNSKRDPDPAVGIGQLRAAKSLVGALPLVAIGGITPDNVRAVLAAGADSVAVIGAIIGNAPKIAENMRRMVDLAGR